MVLLTGAGPHNTGIRVISPQDGATIEAGGLLTVLVEPEGATPLKEIVVSTTGAITGTDASPFHLQVKVSQDLGQHTLAIAAVDNKNKQFLKEIVYYVETNLPIESLRVVSPTLWITTEGEISAIGVFSDGIEREITQSRETTYTSSNPEVATVTPDGRVQAVGDGKAIVTVTYKEKSATVSITVEIERQSINIDINPKKRRNRVKLGSHGHIDVAILSSPTFSAATSTTSLSSLR